jgi:VanZ family protein
VRRSRALSLWLPAVLWAAVIFGFSSVPSLGTGLGTWDLLLRKAAHMAEYAILAVLLARALGSYAWAFGGAVAYAVTDEIHQTFVAGRAGRPLDVLIDAAGAALGLVAWWRLRSRRWSART